MTHHRWRLMGQTIGQLIAQLTGWIAPRAGALRPPRSDRTRATRRQDRLVVVTVLLTGLVGTGAFANAATLEPASPLDGARSLATVPVPKLAPRSELIVANLSAARRADPSSREAMGPDLPIAQAIERELTVDVSLAVANFYAARDHAPLWQDEGRSEALRRRLAEAAVDGLDPADYRIALAPGTSAAWRDVSLTEMALTYARHLHSGRIEPRSISRIMGHEPPALNERAFLRQLARGDLDLAFRSAEPPHPQYRRLRERLAHHLATRQSAPPAVGRGPNLKLSARGDRVAILRSRLDATVQRGTDPTRFDEGLRQAVIAYQREQGLGADGIVGPRTLARLDEGLGEDIESVLVTNMERWRWLPSDLGRAHVFVNVPAFEVAVMRDGLPTYRGRVIVGTPQNPTPIFSDEIEHVIVNPYWNVPYSIATNEMLGGIMANPRGYFRRRGYEAVYRGRVVDPGSLVWGPQMLRQVRIRQRPGRGNALGSVKFMFPNKHAVYLHDTPTKHLFNRARRAYSHGCVRVDQPFVFADALLAAERDLSGPGIQRLVGGGRRHLELTRNIPVHLAYFTVEVTPDGRLERYGDVYGFDARTKRALGL